MYLNVVEYYGVKTSKVIKLKVYCCTPYFRNLPKGDFRQTFAVVVFHSFAKKWSIGCSLSNGQLNALGLQKDPVSKALDVDLSIAPFTVLYSATFHGQLVGHNH